MFGDVRLNGILRQKIDYKGQIWYKGIMHFFGARLPIQVIIKPTNKALQGEKIYYAFTYLPEQKYKATSAAQKSIQWKMVRARANAERKVRQILQRIGVFYEYKKNQKIIPTPEQCKRCIRKSRRGYIKRERSIFSVKIRRVPSKIKGNQPVFHGNSMDARDASNAGLSQ